MWNSIGDADLNAVRRLIFVNLIFVMLLASVGSKMSLPLFLGGREIEGFYVYACSIGLFCYGVVRALFLCQERPARIQMEYDALNRKLSLALNSVSSEMSRLNGATSSVGEASGRISSFLEKLGDFKARVAPYVVEEDDLSRSREKAIEARADFKRRLEIQGKQLQGLSAGITRGASHLRRQKDLQVFLVENDAVDNELDAYARNLAGQVAHLVKSNQKLAGSTAWHSPFETPAPPMPPLCFDELKALLEDLRKLEVNVNGLHNDVRKQLAKLKEIEVQPTAVAERNSRIFEYFVPVVMASGGIGFDLGMIAKILLGF